MRSEMMASADTLTPPQHGEAHVWRVSLDRAAWRRSLSVLSQDESARAARFAFEPDRRRWAAGRAALRRLLGRYLGAAPEGLTLDVGLWGKPFLPRCPLRFNVTHSGGETLLAFAWRQEIGIDLERRQPGLPIEELAPQIFSDRECAWLRERASEEQQDAAFLTLWTAKEAYVKVAGQGLSFPLRRLSLLPGLGSDQFQAFGLVSLSPIFVCRLEAGPEHFAALALEGTPAAVRYFDCCDAGID